MELSKRKDAIVSGSSCSSRSNSFACCSTAFEAATCFAKFSWFDCLRHEADAAYALGNPLKPSYASSNASSSMTFSLFAPNASSSSLSPSSTASILSRSCFRGFSVVPSSFFTTVTPLNLTVNVFASPSSNTSVAHVLHTSFNTPTAVAFFETTFGVHLIDIVISSSLFTIFGSNPPANPNSSYSLSSSSPSNRYSQIFQFRFVSLTIFTRSSEDVVISTTPNLTTGTTAIERSDTPSFFASLSFIFFFVFFSSKLFLLLLLSFAKFFGGGWRSRPITFSFSFRSVSAFHSTFVVSSLPPPFAPPPSRGALIRLTGGDRTTI